MAFVLQLTDGTDTIDFMTESFQVEDGGLQITPPEEVQTWTDPAPTGGKGLVDSRYGNRTVTITFQVAGETRAAMRDQINRVNRVIHRAIEHSLGQTSERVTLKYGWDGVNEVDHFEVLSGKLTLPDDMLSVEKLHSRWGSGNIFALRGCELELVVGPYAYGLSPSTGSLIELPLTNRNGSGTGGRIVRPFTDTYISTKPGNYFVDSYVEIDGAQIKGDAPAKVRIEVTTPGSVDLLCIGAHTKINAPLFFYAGDSNVELASGGSFTSSSYVLGGKYWRRATSSPYPNSRIFRLKIPNSAAYGSKLYRVFVSAGYYPLGYTRGNLVQLRVESEQGFELDRGQVSEVYYAFGARNMIMDLGVVQIPPYPATLPNPQDVYLSLYQADVTQFFPFTLNYIALLPVENGYRELSLSKGAVNYTGTTPTFIDDGWAGLAYLKGTNGKTTSAVSAQYAPITLLPGVTQRIWFLPMGHEYVQANTDIYTVRVYYAPAYQGAV